MVSRFSLKPYLPVHVRDFIVRYLTGVVDVPDGRHHIEIWPRLELYCHCLSIAPNVSGPRTTGALDLRQDRGWQAAFDVFLVVQYDHNVEVGITFQCGEPRNRSHSESVENGE